jgi:purine-binding chemotaxis protein CheW
MHEAPALDHLGKLSYGLMRIGDRELAIPTQNLREALTPPPQLPRLLTGSELVAGAVNVRGVAVPVLDIHATLGLPPRETPPSRVVLVSHGQHLFGVQVDALGGVVNVQAEQCQPVDVMAPEQANLIREILSLDDGRRLVSVLCLEGILKLANVPVSRVTDVRQLTATPRDTPQTVGSDQATQRWQPCLMFDCEDMALCIDAHVVDTVIDLDASQAHFVPDPHRAGGHVGILQTDSRKLAVLDTLALLQLGMCRPDTHRQVLVIRVQGRPLGLLIQRVAQITRADVSTLRDIPTMAFEAPDMFEGILPGGHARHHLKIAAPALMQRNEVASMASIHGRYLMDNQDTTRATTGANAASRRDVYLTYYAGGETASPLNQVREILHMPTELMRIQRSGDCRLGVFNHRGAPIPIVDLCTLLGQAHAPAPHNQRLLLIEVKHGLLALRVDRVRSIEQIPWQHAPLAQDQFRHADPLTAALNARELLTLAHEGDKRCIPGLDLKRVALALEARFTQSMPPAQTPEPLTNAQLIGDLMATT